MPYAVQKITCNGCVVPLTCVPVPRPEAASREGQRTRSHPVGSNAARKINGRNCMERVMPRCNQTAIFLWHLSDTSFSPFPARPIAIGRPIKQFGILIALLGVLSQSTSAQSALPPRIGVQNIFTLMPDGSQNPVLLLNQSIGMSVYFVGDWCDPTVCTDRQGSDGWKYLPVAFHVDAPGASQTDAANSGIDKCGIGTGSGLWAGAGIFTNQVAELGGVTPFFGFYAQYATPGTKSWTITAYACASAGGPETTQVLAQKVVTFTIGAVLFDPVPADLTPGSATITTNPDTLAASATAIQGVAADGVSLALVEIPTANVGDSVTVTLLNDQNGAGTPNEDGALGLPGATTFSATPLTTSAVSTSSQQVYAFVLYRAPIDFARPTGGTYKVGTCGAQQATDDQLPCRSVSLQIQINNPTNTVTLPVTIVRPPVILVHGMWADDPNRPGWTWNNFGPLLSSGVADNRFFVATAEYNRPIQLPVTATDPADAPKTINQNAMGFLFNAPGVLTRITDLIGVFKAHNPANIPVAAVQADIVTHSMGGDIVRTSVLLPDFLSRETFGQGSVHKLITVGTPHLGSPLAQQLMSSNCTRNKLAKNGLVSLRSITVSGTLIVSGAIGDLSPNSPALAAIASPGPHPHPIPTAFIAGILSSQNLAGLDVSGSNAKQLHDYCGSVFGDPLALQLTSTGWPTVFSNFNGETNSDGIVGLGSALNTPPNPPPTTGFQFSGYVHTTGLVTSLGFVGPSLVDPAIVSPQTISVPTRVIKLLNTPYTQSAFSPLNP